MRILHAFCTAVLVVWTLATGAVTAVIGIHGCEGWAWIQAVTGTDPLPPILVGGVMILIALLWLYSQDRLIGFVSFDTEKGRVSVSLEAIREYLAKMSVDLPEVLSARPHIFARKSGIDVTLDIKLRSGASIPDVTRGLQDRVRFGIEQDIGLPAGAAVKVRITSLVGEEPRKAKSKSAPAEPEMRGPTYPL